MFFHFHSLNSHPIFIHMNLYCATFYHQISFKTLKRMYGRMEHVYVCKVLFNEYFNNSITVEMSKYCLEYAMVIWLVSHTSFSILAIQSGKSLITFLVKICHLNFYHCITKRTQQTLKIAITIIKSVQSILKMFSPSSRLPPALTWWNLLCICKMMRIF